MHDHARTLTSCLTLALALGACVVLDPADLGAGDLDETETESETGDEAETTESETDTTESDTGTTETETGEPEGGLAPWGFTHYVLDLEAQWLDFADLDGDGDLDVFAVQFGTGSVWLGDGAGAFELHHQVALATAVDSMVTGRFLGSEDTDLIVFSSAGDGQILINDGSGALFDGLEFPIDGFHGFGSVALDANGDELTDLFIPQGHGQGGHLVHNNLVVFEVEANVPSPACYFSATAVADLDGDGRDDVVGTGSCNQIPGVLPAMVYRHVDGVFTVAQTLAGMASGVVEGGDIELVDLDGDEDLDLVAAGNGGLFTAENLGAGTFAEPSFVAHDYAAYLFGATLARLELGPANMAWVLQNHHDGLDVPGLLIPEVGFGALSTEILEGLAGEVLGAHDIDGDQAPDLAMLVDGHLELWLTGG